jgi:hypothetical protein
MTREEKCQMAIEKGFTYNPETGDIFGIRGSILKNTDSGGYFELYFQIKKKRFYLKGHQFAWYWVNKECVEEIDHRNRIRLDNRITNLRSVTKQENMWNSKAKGYYWHKRSKKWEAQIFVNNNHIHLGYFDNEEDARAAYLEAKEKYHIIK